MKNITLPIMLLFSCFALAQAPRGFYLSAGVNSMSLKSDDLMADPGMGFKGGLNFNWGYHQTYNYQIEVMVNMASVKALTVDENLESSGTTKFNFNTIDVGFFFNYYILKPEEDKFFLGPQFGVNAAFAGTFEPSGSDNEYYLPHRLDSNQFENMPKAVLGAGLGLTGGYNDFRFDLRYTLGLTNVLADVKTDSYDEFNQYTGPALEGKINMVSFTVSYRLNKLFGGE